MVLRVLERGWSIAEAAMAAGVSERTCSKWVGRYRVEGEAGLLDRCSAPKSIPHRTPDELVEVIVLLRKLRMTGAEIAFCLALALSTVSAVLLRVGLGKLSRLQPPEPPNRYERRHAGELLHVDVKKLGRIAEGRAGHRVHGNRGLQRSPRKRDAAGRDRRLVGWEYVHVCVDDATRLAYVEVLPDEKALTAVGFLHRAVAFYARHAISVRAVMSDNGACYRSTIHAFACRSMGCDTSAPGPTGRAPTAKQSASSAPCSGAGPTARSTAQATNAPPRLTAGYGPTTIAAHTAPSATSPRSPASPS
jgi:transposase-like protein